MPFRTRPRSDRSRPELFDTLEDRLAFYSPAFLADVPALSDMKNNQDTVIRMQTAQGFIDIELYDVGGPPARLTAENFLNYIRSGSLDNTFFHRLEAGFVLQGGGFSLKDPVPANPPRFDSVVTFPPVVNEFNELRSNVERTIAMAKLGSDPNSATSQFFFNLADNSENLNNQNGGFTVFGKVIRGWSVITTIAGFNTRNLNQFLAGSQNAFDKVPLSGPNDTDVVSIIDVEVIKRKNQTAFFVDSSYFPDAFRSGNSTATIDLVNPDSSQGAGSQYLIIARFESGLRDKVVAEGFLFAGAHISIPVYKAQDPSVNRVRGGTPFGYEVVFTRPIAASVTITDQGATYSQSFTQPSGLTEANLQTWSFANGQKGTGLNSFLSWMNLTDQSVTVTATFYPEAGTAYTITKVVNPLRRMGLDVGQLPLVPAGLYSVKITSTKPIVTALTQHRAFPARGSTETGQVTGFATEGVLPGVIIPSVGQSTISVLYAEAAPASITVNFEFILNNGTILTNNAPFTLNTTVRRRVLDLSVANGGLPRNQAFTIRYRVANDAAPVSVALTSINNGQSLTTAFQTFSTQSVYFAGGFTDPSNTNNNETISLFNPFRNAGYTMNYTIKFHFDHGTSDVVVPAGGTGQLAPSHRVEISVRSLTEVMARIQSGTQFRHYSISIVTTFGHNSAPVDGAVFAQLTRVDTTPSSLNTTTTGPSFASTGPAFLFTDPAFKAT